MGEYDGEIGRGRQRGSGDDSSSSRESSKERPVSSHRIASPAHTEEGDSAMQPIANDDTPPPQTRPLIRQALGFSSDQPPQSINTYEAQVSETVPKPGMFLPGQAVFQPPVSKPAEKPKKPRIKRTDAYPGQQSRFRIQTYDPTPSGDPPVDRGSGPYASMYRGVSGPPMDSSRENSSTADHPPSSTPSSKASNPSRAKASDSRNSTAGRSQPAHPPSRNRIPPAKTKSSSSQPDYLPSNQHPSSYSQHQPPPSHYPLSASHSSTSSSNYHGSSSVPPAASPPYYRHDHQSFSREQRERDYQQAYGGPTAGYDAAEEAQKRSKYPLRMVTVLIQDMRSGTIDHQLAEVKVPLRPSDVPEDGFWADSRDIAYQLQRGPSRIDGPARAYTLRGKYRQFILRVTADNQDEIMSANVGIQPDRTFDLVVELLSPPGGPPLAPKIPTELLGPSYDDAQSNSMGVDLRSPQITVKDARKRPNSPSFDDYDGQRSVPQSYTGPNKTPRHSYSHQYSPRHSPRHASPHYSGGHANTDSRGLTRRQSNPMDTDPPLYTFPPPLPLPQHSPRPVSPAGPMRSLRPEPSDSESLSPEPDGEFMAAVDRLLQEDSAWPAFYKAKAGNKVADVLKQYEFVTKKCKELRGKAVKGFQQRIADEHIVQALKIDEKNYLQMCNKTMDLLMKYGKQGYHYEDPRVESLINDTSPPKYNSNPYKQILHFLEELDENWHNGKTEHRQRAQQSHSPTLPGQASRQLSSHSDSLAQRSRSSKGFFTQ